MMSLLFFFSTVITFAYCCNLSTHIDNFTYVQLNVNNNKMAAVKRFVDSYAVSCG